MEELQKVCQQQLEQLSEFQELLKGITAASTGNLVKEMKSLPFFTSLLPLYQKKNSQDLLLLEINQQLRRQKQQKELNSICQSVSNVILNDGLRKNAIEKWHTEMLDYCQQIDERDTASYTEDRYFYNVSFNNHKPSDGDGDVFVLSFCTRHQRRCLMLTIESKSNKSSTLDNLELVSCQSSLGFDNLFSDVEFALQTGVSAKEFVENTLWKPLNDIANYD